MKRSFLGLLTLLVGLNLAGCSSQDANVDVVDLNKVLDALVAVLDEGTTSNEPAGVAGALGAGGAILSATDGSAEVNSTAEIQVIEPEKQDATKESSFLQKYADKLNEMKAMNATVGVSMTPGGEIIGFLDPNENLIQDVGETKEFTVTIDTENKRLVASDNNGYHRPYGYHYRPSGMMMGYMLGSMMGRQGSYYSGPMAASRPSFSSTPMSDSNYHRSAVSSVRSRVSSAASTSARLRTGSKGFSFGK